MRSIAGEYLQELENLTGSERQKQEEAVMVSMAGLYIGKLLYSRIRLTGLTRPHSAGIDAVRTVYLDISASFLPTNIMKTESPMSSLFLALFLFPSVQNRAQAELDAVVGRDRLPTFDDKPRLPYIEALCKELMRWNMSTPIGDLWTP